MEDKHLEAMQSGQFEETEKEGEDYVQPQNEDEGNI